MPIITVQMAKGRTIAQKQQFVETVTREAVQTFNVKEEWVTVIFDEYERENWASSGELHAVKFGEGCGKEGSE
ncbi:4-oxalocrotonate tautomerase family protein [Lysinibacillus sp. NPDC096418]|uniref:tautomerase family protein n=1 Tax=Lysinibacillus sp. NPDC096418 TaxID=3364138 RepID=UPI003811574D